MSSSHGSPRASSSEFSPISPISSSSSVSIANPLPEWMRTGRRRLRFLTQGRLRLAFIAAGFILLGWLLTSTLGPAEEYDLDGSGFEHDVSSAGVLTEPSGYGLDSDDMPSSEDKFNSRPFGHPSDGEMDEFEAEIDDIVRNKYKNKPTLNGALADLHSAVTDKLQEWKPHFGSGHRNRPMTTTSTSTARRVQSTGTSGSRKKPPRPHARPNEGEQVQDGLGEEDRLGARTRIGKCTILFNGNSFWERAIKSHEEHDKLHGYRMHVLRQNLLDDVWSKPAYILSLLLRELAKPESERLEWIFWVDADTVILNPKVPIETFLPPPGSDFDDIHLMYSNDWNGLNNGVFPVRVNRWSVELFLAITSFRHYNPDVGLVFRDQSAMDITLKHPRFKRHVVEAPQRWFNAYQGEHNETLSPNQIRRGDLLVHFAGVTNREERMGFWLNRAEQHLDDWEVPVKSTSYPQEARDFWDEQRQRRHDEDSTITETRKKAEDIMTELETRMSEYSDRLSEDQKTSIEDAKEQLTKILNDDGANKDNIDMIKEDARLLEEVAQPLTEIIKDINGKLLESAHKAIFAGEKDLLEAGFSRQSGGEGLDPSLSRLSSHIRALKDMVMQPQELWNKLEIAAATNAVTEARAEWQETKAAAALEEGKAKDLQDQILKEASLYAFPSEALASSYTATISSGSVDASYTSPSVVEAEGAASETAAFEADASLEPIEGDWREILNQET
ncbi:glycosyltransferase family 34 protein [Polychaeton citri CBS 116435]|uniref:Glycosyltransferase family 34 protein n=1 Tax=Polychaeton citri CBS 116435 TaxID=1314669 RepID=A0A9P4UT48_9PEZI|nr:glycosyltransferase family 34 protein [Polychaeton citri CBS 116435]